ncbi:MAG: HAD family phosphatase [Firmicutes bacterium]|nr:HAD family phosphatase [Bacillota bacterium]
MINIKKAISSKTSFIFDLDGTLFDSMGVWVKIDNDFLSRRGIAVPAFYGHEISSKSASEGALYTKELFGLPESTEEILKEWYEMSLKEYETRIKLKPFVYDYLLKIKNSGKKVAVATALSENLYIPALKNNKIFHIFDALTSTDEVKRGKSFPDVYELAMRKIGATPNETVIFDDVLPAIKASKQTGATVVGVYDSFSLSLKEEIKRTADFYIESFEELI